MQRVVSVLALGLSVLVDVQAATHILQSWFSGVDKHSLRFRLLPMTVERETVSNLEPRTAHAQTMTPEACLLEDEKPFGDDGREVIAVIEDPDAAVVAETMRKVSPFSDPSVPFTVVEYLYSDGSREAMLAAQVEENPIPGTGFLYSSDENGLQMVHRVTLEQYNAWLAAQGIDPLLPFDPEEPEILEEAAETEREMHEKTREYDQQQDVGADRPRRRCDAS